MQDPPAEESNENESDIEIEGMRQMAEPKMLSNVEKYSINILSYARG